MGAVSERARATALAPPAIRPRHSGLQRDGECVVAGGEHRCRDPDRGLLDCIGPYLPLLGLLWLHDGYAVPASLRGPARGVRPHPLRYPGSAGRRGVRHGARSRQQGDFRDFAHADGGCYPAGRGAALSDRPARDAVGEAQSAAVEHAARGKSAAVLQGQPRTVAYIRLYFGPLPPSRGVQRGPSTSVALQSTQFGAFTRSRPSTSSYTPAGHTWA